MSSATLCVFCLNKKKTSEKERRKEKERKKSDPIVYKRHAMRNAVEFAASLCFYNLFLYSVHFAHEFICCFMDVSGSIFCYCLMRGVFFQCSTKNEWTKAGSKRVMVEHFHCWPLYSLCVCMCLLFKVHWKFQNGSFLYFPCIYDDDWLSALISRYQIRSLPVLVTKSKESHSIHLMNENRIIVYKPLTLTLDKTNDWLCRARV